MSNFADNNSDGNGGNLAVPEEFRKLHFILTGNMGLGIADSEVLQELENYRTWHGLEDLEELCEIYKQQLEYYNHQFKGAIAHREEERAKPRKASEQEPQGNEFVILRFPQFIRQTQRCVNFMEAYFARIKDGELSLPQHNAKKEIGESRFCRFRAVSPVGTASYERYMEGGQTDKAGQHSMLHDLLVRASDGDVVSTELLKTNNELYFFLENNPELDRSLRANPNLAGVFESLAQRSQKEPDPLHY